MGATKPGDMNAFIAVDDFAFHVSDICDAMPPSADVGTTAAPSTSSTTTKRSTTTTKRTTTKTTTKHDQPTTNAATPSPSNPHKHTALIVGVVFGVLILLIIVVAIVITIRRRNVQLPGLSDIQGFLNPNYTRFDNTGG